MLKTTLGSLLTATVPRAIGGVGVLRTAPLSPVLTILFQQHHPPQSKEASRCHSSSEMGLTAPPRLGAPVPVWLLAAPLPTATQGSWPEAPSLSECARVFLSFPGLLWLTLGPCTCPSHRSGPCLSACYLCGQLPCWGRISHAPVLPQTCWQPSFFLVPQFPVAALLTTLGSQGSSSASRPPSPLETRAGLHVYWWSTIYLTGLRKKQRCDRCQGALFPV